MANLNDIIKVIFDGETLKENRFDVGTTRDLVEIELILINTGKTTVKELKFTFPEGIAIIKPKKLPDRMVPEHSFKMIVRIDTSINRTFSIEIEGDFLHVVAR